MTPREFKGELEANRLTVRKLLDLAQAGTLRVPPFQRPLRWRRSDHLLLLDSLNRGYPVGTLLLWKRPAEKATKVYFGGVAVDSPKSDDTLWIVDGQQRITSIVGCLLHPGDLGRARRTEFAFYFDLDGGEFVPADRPSTARLVPVNRLRDAVATSAWAREAGVSDDQHRRAQEVGQRLRDYEIPAYVTNAQSDEALRTIFARANTAGKRMRQEEVFEALNKGLRPSDSPAGLTERLQSVLHALGFGPVEGDKLQRALVCVAGYSPTEVLPGALARPGAATEWETATAEALRRTVEFLRQAARIPHASAMPYALPLILLPRFFHLWPDPSERSTELLVRWVWRGIAGQTHMATNQQLGPHFVALKSGSEEAAVQKMLRLVAARRPASLPASSVYNLRGMRTRLELTALFGLGPRSLKTGEEVSASEVFEAHAEEDPTLFGGAHGRDPGGDGPRAMPPDLASLPVLDPRLRRSVASRFLHPPVPRGQNAFAALVSRADESLLATHGIGGDLVPAVRARRWDEVVAGREVGLRRLAVGVIERHARWNEDDDGPSIDFLLRGALEEAP